LSLKQIDTHFQFRLFKLNPLRKEFYELSDKFGETFFCLCSIFSQQKNISNLFNMTGNGEKERRVSAARKFEENHTIQVDFSPSRRTSTMCRLP
jgi:hypothetical protein